MKVNFSVSIFFGIVCFSIFYGAMSLSFPQEKPIDKKHDLTQAKPAKKIIKINPIDTFNTQLSYLIAGKSMPFKHNFNNCLSFINYNRFIRNKWDNLKSNRLNKMSNWISNCLGYSKKIDTSFVFYPFSGGDFLHLYTLYPNANTYFLVAREDVGAIPNLLSSDTNQALNYLHDIDFFLRDVYTRSYFITMNMLADTKSNTKINGMLPILYWTLGNLDFEIINVNFYLKNNIQKKLIKTDALSKNDKPCVAELMIRKKGEANVRKLYYCSFDISDNGFSADSLGYNFISSRVPKNCNSMVKSASYLLHYTTFSNIRNLLLDRSKILIQDDTGIPLKYFKNDSWLKEFYGEYEHPIADFSSSVYQSDLEMSYRDSLLYKGKLNFSMGYHWNSRKQNEMIFKKMQY